MFFKILFYHNSFEHIMKSEFHKSIQTEKNLFKKKNLLLKIKKYK